MEVLLFTVFSALCRGSARAVILLPHPVHSVLSLIASFVSACALMRLLQVEFMALIFVVVYVGAIAVLFLFVVMMLNLNSANTQRTLDLRRLDQWAALVRLSSRMGARRWSLDSSLPSARSVGVLDELDRASGLGWGSSVAYVQWVDRRDPLTTLDTLGQVLYTHKFVDLLLAGFVLLVALVGAIVLTLKVRSFARAKRQQVHQQRSRDADRALMITRVGNSGHSIH